MGEYRSQWWTKMLTWAPRLRISTFGRLFPRTAPAMSIDLSQMDPVLFERQDRGRPDDNRETGMDGMETYGSVSVWF
jgi:hypothetical protein